MTRLEMIKSIGEASYTPNLETGEFSYPKEFRQKGIQFEPIKDEVGHTFERLDIRFEKDDISVLVETKDDYTLPKNRKCYDQLSAYVEYEKKLTGNKIIAIIANTDNDKIRVYRGAVSDENLNGDETVLKSIDEYMDFYTPKINDKESVMQNTFVLNKILHKHSIPEKIRSQFVGTCLLSLKNGLIYENLSTGQINAGVKDILEKLLDGTMGKAVKLVILSKNVLGAKAIANLDKNAYAEILTFINKYILPFINDNSTTGQDLLNLFFTTFNKYTGKADKNQAFTPDHITDLMTKITKVNYTSRILDPCCGSGSFLVRAMTAALDDAPTAAIQKQIKRDQIFGIEFDENVFGLATTNMLIHGDGNSNILNGSCFDYRDWIVNTARPDVILMNPPYNCQRASMDSEYVKTWKTSQKEDPSKGLYFAKWICDTINETDKKATLAILLPVACAIGNNAEMKRIKEDILEKNTLDAVFTLPAEIFYPGASASACCMVFKLGTPHRLSGKTFFGYYKDDGFKKKKNLGRVEGPRWKDIEKEWIRLYQDREVKAGLSATAQVGADDEWLCEAYMQTDYSTLTEEDFQATVNNYLAYLIKNGMVSK